MHLKSKHEVFSLYLPPVMVRVAKSYSATLNPALLCAVILKTYHVAGSKSRNILLVIFVLKCTLSPL